MRSWYLALLFLGYVDVDWNNLVFIAHSVSGLMRRDCGYLIGEAAIPAPSWSQFAGSSEHTCGTEARQSVDSSGVWTQELQHLQPQAVALTNWAISYYLFSNTFTLSCDSDKADRAQPHVSIAMVWVPLHHWRYMYPQTMLHTIWSIKPSDYMFMPFFFFKNCCAVSIFI